MDIQCKLNNRVDARLFKNKATNGISVETGAVGTN